MRRRSWIDTGVFVAVAAVAGWIVWHRTPPARGELAPDRDAVAYRFPIVTIDREAELSSMITAIEDRVAQVASPFEMAELAELYFRRSQITGDPDDYRKCDEVARRSLSI